MATKADEVRFGEGEESRVLSRWIRAKQGRGRGGGLRVIKSKRYQDWDFLVLDGSGLPVTYLEIKVRRQPLKRFGDAIAPVRKHYLAIDIWERHRLPFLMVVEYPDALVEVDLREEPYHVGELKRHDRASGQLHAYWKEGQLKVVDV